MTAASPSTCSGRISGFGFAIANTIGFFAIDRTSAAVTRSGPLTPTNTSAPFMTSLIDPIFREEFVFAANHSFAEFISPRPV